jgi:GDP-L-fucose synthase
VNVGSGREVTTRELVSLIAHRTGFEGRIVWDTTKPDGQPRRCLDISKAEELFGFRVRTSLEEGLERSIAWYRAHRTALTAARESRG